MELTTTPQEIEGSSNGCKISIATFCYGFGANAIEALATKDKWSSSTNEPLDYGGAYGNIWVWNESDYDSDIITFVLAV